MISQTIAAAMIGVSTSTLSSWQNKTPGYLPRQLYIGAHIVYDEDQILEWIASEARAVKNAPLGENHHRARWPDAFVAQVKKLVSEGVGVQTVAKRLGMPRRTVRDIVAGEYRNPAAGVRGKRGAVTGPNARTHHRHAKA